MKLNNKNFFKILVTGVLLIIISMSGYSQVNNQNENLKRYRFIFSTDLFFNTKTQDAIALTKIFVDKLKKEKNINDDVEIVVCKNLTELIEATKTNFDFVLSTMIDFISLVKIGNVDPVLVNQTQGDYGYIYYLITKEDKGYKRLSDLKNCNLRILSRTDGQTPSIWLEKLLRDSKLPKKDKFFKDITFDFVPSNVILPVFFNKLDAAIVTKASFDIMSELNPKIRKDIRIIEISKTLLYGILSFDKRNKDEEREKFVYDVLVTMHKDADGQQFLNLFSLDKIIPYKEIYYKRFLELYN